MFSDCSFLKHLNHTVHAAPLRVETYSKQQNLTHCVVSNGRDGLQTKTDQDNDSIWHVTWQFVAHKGQPLISKASDCYQLWCRAEHPAAYTALSQMARKGGLLRSADL